MLASEDWLRVFRRKIIRWYERNQRQLPWRETCDPYAIWISETMLQQTQVATVLDYYARFLRRFPTVEKLAAAPEQEVLELWAGLGYYRRARQLHAAAKVVVEQFGGRFPSDLDDLQSLPGVGRYTAGAIASFAFDARAPIVEANTMRLYSRLIALHEPPQATASQKRLWEFAEAILPPGKNPKGGFGAINQAVMELGSQICKPKAPLCGQCPVQSLCPTHARGLEGEIPAAKPKKTATALVHVCVIIENRGRLLMRRNAPGEWWEGLWDFPRVDLAKISSSAPFSEPGHPELDSNLELIELAMLETYGLHCRSKGYIRPVKHSVTRYKITLHCYRAKLMPRAIEKLSGEWRWVGVGDSIPLCATAQRLRKWLDKQSETLKKH